MNSSRRAAVARGMAFRRWRKTQLASTSHSRSEPISRRPHRWSSSSGVTARTPLQLITSSRSVRRGTDDPENVVLACCRCNFSKQHRLWPSEWKPDGMTFRVCSEAQNFLSGRLQSCASAASHQGSFKSGGRRTASPTRSSWPPALSSAKAGELNQFQCETTIIGSG
jgi:hypothetical protein